MFIFVLALYLASDPLRIFVAKLHHNDTVNFLSIYFQDKRKMKIRQFIVKESNSKHEKHK